jgi:RNA-directed DNA polymerase
VPPYLKKRAHLIRYADDAIIVCGNREDAEKLMKVLPKRLGKYGLTLHPEKTRLVRFQRPVTRNGKDSEGLPSETFDFLGFSHYWGLCRKKAWAVMRKTAKARLARAIGKIGDWCKENRCESIRKQHRTLSAKIQGHCAYYGITGNIRSLSDFIREATRQWKYWLGRRSNAACLNWEKLQALLEWLPLPRPRIVHSAYRSKTMT